MEHISIIPDYRQAWKVEHKLSDILLLTICAVISGAGRLGEYRGFWGNTSRFFEAIW
ncbi:transposase family protein [Escherichia coli]